MIYDVKITGFDFMNDYEGAVKISLNNQELYAFYLAPYDFAKRYLCIGDIIKADIWLLDGNAKIISIPLEKTSDLHEISKGVIRGQVKKCFSPYEFRVNCDLLEIDIINKDPINLIGNEYIETKGTYQIYLPGTEYDKENTW